MSTRCNVVIKKTETLKSNKRKYEDIVYLYHHHDGYPEGVGAELEEYLKGKIKEFTCSKQCAKFLVGLEDDEYETTTGLHGDIEYLYTIDLNRKTVRCEEVDGWGDDQKFKRLYTHKLI